MKHTEPDNKTVRNFRALTRDYFDETFDRFPVYGSEVGIARYRPELGRHAPAVFERQTRLNRKTLASVEAMPLHDFQGEALLDRWTFISQLRHDLMHDDDLRRWSDNPQVHLDTVADAIHGLLVRHADNLKPVASALISRLRKTPRFLETAGSCIRRPVPLWTRLAAEAAPGLCDLLLSLPEPLAKVSDRSEASLRRSADRAVEAVKAYVRRIARLKPGEEGGFAVGRERFESLLRNRMGMNLTAREAHHAALGLAEKLKAEMRSEARRFHRSKSPHEILAEAREQWTPDGNDLLSAYQAVMERMRGKFEEADVVTFPKGDRLLVKLVPEFMKHQFPMAAYSNPGPLDRRQVGIFWVNDLGRFEKSEAARRREAAQHFGMELTAAHEAYPGHHLQFITQFRHPSLARKLAHHAIYYEGWTLWCEQMAVDLKVSDNPYLRLLQLHDALWRANRIVIDCGLQTGEMSFDAACRRLQREVGFTKARARADVNWYTSAPTIPMSYLLGKMELLRLKRLRVDEGGWTLKQFNDWILKFGAIPWSWIEASGL